KGSSSTIAVKGGAASPKTMAEDSPKAQMSGGKAAFIAIALRTTRSTLRANCAPLPCVAMTSLDKLERRLGFLAIPGLMRIVVAFNALVFLLVRLNPGFRLVVDLDPGRIRHGEVWRLITYIFLPQTDSFLCVFLLLCFLFFIAAC